MKFIEDIQSDSNWIKSTTDRFNRVVSVTISDWRTFINLFVTNKISYTTDFIFRGQTRDLPLISSLARVANSEFNRPSGQLSRFKKESLGVIDRNLSDEQWWEIGQHFSLKTPYLDWTASPGVALFFAFDEAGPFNKDANSFEHYRCVYLLNKGLIEHNYPFDKPSLRFIYPSLNSNRRAIAQQGLFSEFIPEETDDIESSIEDYLEQIHDEIEGTALFKVLIQERIGDRMDCLAFLNSMNINNKTLFPDEHGVAKHTNWLFEFKGHL